MDRRSVLFITAFGLLLYWPLLFRALGGDASVYAYIGDAIVRGQTPYRDAWDIKSPAVFFQYAAGLTIFGHSDTATLAVEFLVALGAAWVIFVAGRRMAGRSAGVLAAAAWLACFQRFQAEGAAGQPETAAAMLSGALFLLAMARGPLRDRDSLAGGALTALLFWYKLPFTLFAFLLVPRLVSPRVIRAAVRGVLPGLAGFAVLGLAVIAYFAGHHALGDLWQGAFVAPFRLASAPQAPLGVHVRQIGRGVTMLVRWVPGVVLLAAIGVVRFPRERRHDARMLLGYAMVAAVIIVVQRNDFEYYWTIMVPPLSILAGVGATLVAADLARIVASGWLRVVVLAAVFCAASVPRTLFFWEGYVAGVLAGDRAAYLQRLGTYCGSDVRVTSAGIVALGKDLGSTTDERETILSFDMNPAVNFYAQRQSPSRFMYLWPLRFEGFRAFGWKQEFTNAVMERAPAYIVICRENERAALDRDGLQAIRDWPVLGEWFSRTYALRGEIGPMHVYQRHGRDPRPPAMAAPPTPDQRPPGP